MANSTDAAAASAADAGECLLALHRVFAMFAEWGYREQSQNYPSNKPPPMSVRQGPRMPLWQTITVTVSFSSYANQLRGQLENGLLLIPGPGSVSIDRQAPAPARPNPNHGTSLI